MARRRVGSRSSFPRSSMDLYYRGFLNRFALRISARGWGGGVPSTPGVSRLGWPMGRQIGMNIYLVSPTRAIEVYGRKGSTPRSRFAAIRFVHLACGNLDFSLQDHRSNALIKGIRNANAPREIGRLIRISPVVCVRSSSLNPKRAVQGRNPCILKYTLHVS